jgi:hypothetical protein
MRTAAVLALIAALAAAGCKEKQTQSPPAPSAPAAARPATPRPSLPEGSAAPAGSAKAEPPGPAPEEGAKPTKPITVAEAAPMVPALTGPALIPLKQTSDQQQVHGTWCLDGTSADDVARQVGHLLSQERYTNLSIRGDAKKAGVMGDRDNMRFSMVVSASSASVCAAPAHYFASATIYKL